MTNEANKRKILAVVASRGWASTEIYLTEARELCAAGLIKLDHRYSVGGNRKPVWVAA